MGESNNDGKPFDPLEIWNVEAWRGIRNEGMDAWAKAMVQAVNSEEYAKTSGAMLDAYLTASIPLTEMLKKAMAQALQQANMPTRADFISFAERLTQVEMQLDDLAAQLDESRPHPVEPPEKKKSKSKGGKKL
jgi:hypothetical protein